MRRILGGLAGVAALVAVLRELGGKRRSGRARAESAQNPRARKAARKLHVATGALAFSVFADSLLEHYRGSFHNRAMYAAPLVSGLTLAASARAAARSSARAPEHAILAAAVATGLVGTVFHIRNVVAREGGFGWLNLFHGAPLGAPLGLTVAGGYGLAATAVTNTDRQKSVRAARVLAGFAAAGLAGTSMEAGLLHFRGAFQDSFMYIPVVLPPLAAAALLRSLSRPGQRTHAARVLLRATGAAGIAGVAFHAWGIHRNMGGWRNWSQMLQQGPPLPAPPSFTGMALAGLSALDLMDTQHV